MNKKKLCVVTGTRAEYGILSVLLKELKKNNFFELQIIATGTHISEKYGLTYKEIESDGFKIDKKINIKLLSDSPNSISKSMAIGIESITSSFTKLNPDLIILLGDRFEIFSAAIAASLVKIPIAHIHGGELTEGAMDDAIRHCITKLSHIHFVATNEYRNRVIQLGENPKNVFNVGGLGVDNIKNTELLSKYEVENFLKCKFYKKNLLITYHPETLKKDSPGEDFRQLLNSLESFKDTRIIFTMPNADVGNLEIFTMIKKFIKRNNNAFLYKSMGKLVYLSCMSYVDAVIGNSSSGIMEAPTFKKATINIGARQKGRIQASSIVNVSPNSSKITKAIISIYDKKFQNKLKKTINPYGAGGASLLISAILKKLDFNNLINKAFFDFPKINDYQ